MLDVHPYEEVAFYDIYPLSNTWAAVGAGMIGELPEAVPTIDFLMQVKHKLQTDCIRHTAPVKPTVKKIAICGGAGSFLL